MVFNANYGREERHGQGRSSAICGSASLAAASAVAAGLSAFVVVRLEPRSVILFFSLLIGVVLLTYFGKRYLVRKLGGVTGDAIGALSELNEMLVLLVFVIFSSGN